jgi:hypothetical protein
VKSCVKKDLMALGFGEYQARRIIQQAKQELVNRGHTFYAGNKIGRVPSWMVEEIIGFDIHTGQKYTPTKTSKAPGK